MAADINEIFHGCVSALQNNEKTVEQCLREHENVRAELEPMLRAAIAIMQTCQVTPDARRKQQSRDMLIAAVEQKSWEAGIERKAAHTPAKRQVPRVRKLALRLVSITTAFTLISGGTLAMAKESLPGSPLYPLKLAVENARIKMAGDEEVKSKLYLQAAKERIDEMEQLELEGKSKYYPHLVEAASKDIELAEQILVKSNAKDFKSELKAIKKKHRAASVNNVSETPVNKKPAIGQSDSDGENQGRETISKSYWKPFDESSDKMKTLNGKDTQDKALRDADKKGSSRVYLKKDTPTPTTIKRPGPNRRGLRQPLRSRESLKNNEVKTRPYIPSKDSNNPITKGELTRTVEPNSSLHDTETIR